jgi:SSS family solute:Na+ symporter
MIRLLGTADILVFCLLAGWMAYSGVRAALRKKDAERYFMAERNLPWWSVAGSIYGTNVSLSQIIGMLGIGYSIGFAQSHYEVLAIPAILLLCFVFIPVYRRRKVFTLSEFLGHRYNPTVRLLYTLIILAVILILLVGGLYIGSRQLGLLFSDTAYRIGYLEGILLIGGVACMLVLFGGMESVVAAENLITVLMVLSLVAVGWFTLSHPAIGGLSGLLRLDSDPASGLGKMRLYLPSNHPDLPWTGVFSGLMVLHSFFWTTNQFEVQRILAARSDRDAQLGAIAAGFLKLTIPFFSIAAGVAAAYLFRDSYGLPAVKPDDAFMMLLGKVVPTGYGLLGLILAGFTGAIFSSIYSMLNSASTLMSMEVYRNHFNRNASDRRLVLVGKLSVLLLCILSGVLAYLSFDPESDGNFFLTLSKNTSYLKPGIVSAFLLGVFWRRCHPASAVAAILAAPVFSVAVEQGYARWASMDPGWIAIFGEKLNFLHRVFVVFVLCILLQVLLSLWFGRKDGYMAEQANLAPDLGSIRRGLVILAVIHLHMFFAMRWFGMPQRSIALPAALLTGMVFLIALVRRRAVVSEWLRSERLYAGILAAATAWILYYFA